VLAPDQKFARIGAGSWPAASSVVPPALAASEFLNASLRNTTRAPPRPSGGHWTELCPQGWSHHPHRMRAVCLYRARLPYPGHHPDRTKEDQAQGSAGPRRAYTGRSTLRRRRSFRTS